MRAQNPKLEDNEKLFSYGMKIDNFQFILDDDAMAPRIMTGDTALIHYQQRLCAGDIGLFIYSPYPIGFIAQYKQVGSSIVLTPASNSIRIALKV